MLICSHSARVEITESSLFRGAPCAHQPFYRNVVKDRHSRLSQPVDVDVAELKTMTSLLCKQAIIRTKPPIPT